MSYLLLLVVIILVLKVTGFLKPISSASMTIVEPVYDRLYSGGDYIANFFKRPKEIHELQADNETLREKNIKLTITLTKLQSAAEENLTLRKLLDFFENEESNFANSVSRIIGRDPENFALLLLNVGERDGVEVGNAVIAEEGILIGKITEVSTISSKALILIDAQSLVAVTISNGAPGNKLAQGEKGLSLVLNQIPQQENITKGQLVITSGLEPKIPRGLLVGEIEEVISEKNDLFQKAVLKPLVDFDSIHLVAVILSSPSSL